MKKVIYLLLVIVFASFAGPKETITLSGKISNADENKIRIRGEAFEKEITLKPDGSFSESFPIDYSGTYTLGTKNNRIALYLAKGTKLAINADDKNFTTTLAFSGNGSVENQYIAKKNEIVNKALGDPQAFYSQDENTFLTKNSELKKTVLELYNKTKFSDAAFKTSELKNINYFEQLLNANYAPYHAHYTKKEDFKVSAGFPLFDEKTNLDSEEDFLFSNPYKQIVAAKFRGKIMEQLGEDADYTSKVALPEIKKIKSPSIKNSLLQNLGYEVGAGNPDAENLYKELMTLSTNQKFKDELTTKFNKIKTLTVGKPSPKFNYENHKGGKTSLDQLAGKYVYIDVWATWCGPCRKEIPFLQEVEKQYHGKNIEFVSLSIDAKKDHEKWKNLVNEKSLGGIQLFADNDWNSQFVKDYAIEGIPRFILVDTKGNIVTADAPRPSDPKLVELFRSLGI